MTKADWGINSAPPMPEEKPTTEGTLDKYPKVSAIHNKKRLSTTITTYAFKRKMAELKRDGYFVEYKLITDHWKKRIENIDFPCVFTFLVGSKIGGRFRAIGCKEINYLYLPRWVQDFFKDHETGQFYFIACVKLEGGE